MLAAGCGAAAAPAQEAAPAAPATTVAGIEVPTTTPPTGGPKQVKPVGNAINARKARWKTAKPVSKNRKVQIGRAHV